MPDDVPEAEKTRRILALQALQREIQIEWHDGLVGTSQRVLVDSVSKRRASELSGRTSGNVVVNFGGGTELIGLMGEVRVTAAGPHSVRGEWLGGAD
jgi:tRNA-2-methylthio-N6-dimethylallyladenosine synthase